MQKLHLVMMDGTERDLSVPEPEETIIVRRDSLPENIKHLDLMPGYFTAETGSGTIARRFSPTAPCPFSPGTAAITRSSRSPRV